MKNSHEDAELLMIPQMGKEKIPSYRQVVHVPIHHFYILGEIDEPDSYLDLIHTLKTAEEHESIFMYINSEGGSLYTTIQIINAMQNCHGTVITCLEGQACSAATMIFLAGHKHIINPFGAFMIHKYSHGVVGKGSDVTAQVMFTERYYDELAYALYPDVMTTEEIRQMLDGKDFWFSSQQVQERLISAGREVLGSEIEARPTLSDGATLPVMEVATEDADEECEDDVVKPAKAKTARKTRR